MPLRPYSPPDSLALATIKATCDLTDPLALYCRHINPDLHQDQVQAQAQAQPQHTAGPKIVEAEKQWKAYIKSSQRSFELEVLLPGSVCWVIYTYPHHHHHNHHKTQDGNTDDDGGNKDGGDGGEEEVVGFAIWNRHGTSPAAQKWRGHGQKVSTRLKTIKSYITMTITYPFDTSINHAHMSQFQRRIRSAPSPLPSGQKLTLPRERWELEALYIAPEYQRRGYGTEALRWGIGVAREEGVDVWLWSSDAGKSLYEKVGFEGMGRIGFGDLLLSSNNTTTENDKEDDGSKGEGEEKEEVALWVMRWRDKDRERS